MTTTQTTKTEQSVTIIYNGDTVRVHAAGCRDAKRDARGATTTYTISASSLEEVAEDFYSDFIAEGSMTSDEAMGYTEFLPCVGLNSRDALLRAQERTAIIAEAKRKNERARMERIADKEGVIG